MFRNFVVRAEFDRVTMFMCLYFQQETEGAKWKPAWLLVAAAAGAVYYPLEPRVFLFERLIIVREFFIIGHELTHFVNGNFVPRPLPCFWEVRAKTFELSCL